MVAVFIIAVSIMLACVIALMMLIMFVVNGRLQNDTERLERENRCLRLENQKLRDEMRRRAVRLASRVPRKAGW